MAFHGGLLGVIVAMALFARTRGAAVPRGDRPRRAVRADRLRRRPHRQLHQRRAVGPVRRSDPAVGRWSFRSRARRCRAIRRSSTSSRSRACCSSSVLWIYAQEAARPRPGVGRLPGRLRRAALHRRVLPRARQLPRPARARHEHGPVAVRADDRSPASRSGRGGGAARADRGDGAAAARPRRDQSDAPDLPRHRDHRPQPRVGRPHHRDRLRRDRQPAPAPAASSTSTSTPSGATASTPTRCTACRTSSSPTSRCSRTSPTSCSSSCATPRSSSTTPPSTSASSTPSCAGSAGRAFTGHGVRVTDSLSMARDSFPGKSNSLDALCKRFEVNNSARELHGALLDAGPARRGLHPHDARPGFARHRRRPTRSAAELAARPIDFSALELVVIAADEDELAAHAAHARRDRQGQRRPRRLAPRRRGAATPVAMAQ